MVFYALILWIAATGNATVHVDGAGVLVLFTGRDECELVMAALARDMSMEDVPPYTMACFRVDKHLRPIEPGVPT